MKHFFKIASFSLALCAFLGTASLKEWAFLNAGAPTAEAVEAPLLNFQIVSDIHYNINGYNTGYAEPRPKFLSALDFNAEHFPGSDALVVAGDFTVAGTEDQYSQFFGDGLYFYLCFADPQRDRKKMTVMRKNMPCFAANFKL